MTTAIHRRFAIGAESYGEGTHFRVWAPSHHSVDVVLDGKHVKMKREESGYFSAFVEFAKPGMYYRYRIGTNDSLLPDPASRFQPEGPHGPSQIVDPHRYEWRDGAWGGVRIPRQIIYEMHIGTFTREGTWKSAEGLLDEIAQIGITLLEIMPVAEFPGTFGWGYDGVDLFAPSHLYGIPDDFRSFVDTAHALGLGVILDVVYNHLGPDGNYLKHFSEHYFTARYANEWGEPLNLDGPHCGEVREFLVANARYWIEEFHLDGLRLDATQQIFDNSAEHILAEINREARRAAGRRRIVMIAENEPQAPRLVRPAKEGGYELDALWNDDFHHAARVAMTGNREAYYSDYTGSSQELISAVKWGFLFQGQYYGWQKKRRGGSAMDLRPASFVNFIENHDQVANSAHGSRLHQLTTPGRHRAISALLLLGPATPMLFQGQEYGASTPFLYFADHNDSVFPLVEKGRSDFLRQFPSIAYCDAAFRAGAPHERSTFEKCKLDHAERRSNSDFLALHRDLIRLRNNDPVFREQRSDWIHGAVLGPEAFVLRFVGKTLGDRLVVVNLGQDLRLDPAPEPLLAEPQNSRWELLWFSEDPRYGGCGRPPMRHSGMWDIPAHSATVIGARTNV